MFRTNTNASLKNLDTQVEQLALVMQNQPKDAFPSDTRKNLKDCMTITLRSGKDLKERRVERKDIKEKKHAEIGEEFKQHSSETAEEDKIEKMQQERKMEKGNLRKMEEVKAYNPQVPFPQRLQKANLEEYFSKFLNMFKKIDINIPFSEALIKMPHYEKFMKEILSRKRKIAEE